MAQIFRLLTVPAPFVMMYDFLGLDAMTNRRTERLGVYFWNLVWSLDRRLLTTPPNRGVIIGEADDIPDIRFGPLLPNRREHAHRCYEFVGYVLPFDLAALRDRQRLRAELGYGTAPLVVCSVGGLAVGRDLLELCGQAYALLTESIPGLHMVLVCGPGIEPDSLDVPGGVEVRGYVPQLYRNLAASDLAVVQAGGTTTLELTALERPSSTSPSRASASTSSSSPAAWQGTAQASECLERRPLQPIWRERSARTSAQTSTTLPSAVDGADRIADIVLRRASPRGARSAG